MSLKACIETILDIPVIEHFEPVIPSCVTFYQNTELSGLAGDGEESEKIEGYQADIWCRKRGEAERYAKVLKEGLKALESSVTIPQISYIYDSHGKLWRASVTFYIIGEE